MRFVKSFLIVLLLIPVIFVLWMNLTPGYFQYGVCGYVGYYTNDEVEVMKNWETKCRLPSGFERLEARILIRLARLDFNKGSRVDGIGGTQPITAPPALTCPETEWVDCMPGPGSVKAQCQKEYLDWAKKSCPNFQGAAY